MKWESITICLYISPYNIGMDTIQDLLKGLGGDEDINNKYLSTSAIITTNTEKLREFGVLRRPSWFQSWILISGYH